MRKQLTNISVIATTYLKLVFAYQNVKIIPSICQFLITPVRWQSGSAVINFCFIYKSDSLALFLFINLISWPMFLKPEEVIDS